MDYVEKQYLDMQAKAMGQLLGLIGSQVQELVERTGYLSENIAGPEPAARGPQEKPISLVSLLRYISNELACALSNVERVQRVL